MEYPIDQKADLLLAEEVDKKPKQDLSCPICQDTKHKILYDNDAHGIRIPTVICKTCGTVYTKMFIKDYYESGLYREVHRTIFT